MAANSKEGFKPLAAIIPEAPTHQTPHDNDGLEDTDSEVMTAPGTASTRETHDPLTPTTEPEHAALATGSLSKAREPVSPVSPDSSPLSAVSPEARTSWVAPAALIAAAAAVPAVIVSKKSFSNPSGQTGPSASAVPSDPSALLEAPSTPFTEPRTAPAVPASPQTTATSAAAPAELPISTPPAAPYSLAAVSANKAAPATAYSPPAFSSAAGTSTSRATEDSREPRSVRRLSSLFVKTSPKDDAPRKPIDSTVDHENSAALVGGAGAVGAAGAAGSDFPSKSQPMSPKSDESLSPKSRSKMRSWFKTKFSKPSSSSPTPGTDAAETGRDTNDATFVGGHTLTSAENVSAKEGTGVGANPTEGMKGNISPAIGSGGLSLPAIGGISGGFAAGTTAAATAAASRVSDGGNSTAAKATPGLPDSGVSTEPKNGLNPGLLDLTGKSKTSGMYPLGSSSHSEPAATETNAKDKLLSTETTSNVSASSDAPATKAATTHDSTVNTAGGPAAKQATKPGLVEPSVLAPGKNTGGLGPLTPETRGPTNSSKSATGDNAAESSRAGGVSGLGGAATGAAVGGFSYATIAGGGKKDPTPVSEAGSSGKKTFTVPSHSNAPGNRASYASYASSNYTSDGATTTGARGVSGSGFGLVGTNIFANITKTGTFADVKDTNTYVTVPPPATAPSTSTAGTVSGESGIDAALTPPRTLHDPADKKNASPVRDSRFLENLEDHF